ncbi:MAG: hypothetical protein A2287_02300 [Candidatus Melainabacteria bacterium RIFOXYA12_FULL_32_12]|nr:MAG: hypothetical protein A2255_04955 [Candidatus Melainabacteria bacterium RIFOXYA2_FULL_32_9]OGI29861.1 MAG: hypothetical protein A2287_02300 [Candidatus Melainabacteria bacterium RIFOXYA12_FULL_32_12]
MTGYILSFTVYTLAMIGIILIGFIIAKKSLISGPYSSPKNKFLSVETCLNLEPRKNLYVVKAGTERFLVSTDTEGSHFLTKLDAENLPSIEESEKHRLNKHKQDFNMAIPILNITRNIFKSDFINQKAFKTKFIEKLNMYVTFQRP